MKKQIRNILSLTLTASILGACSNVDFEDFGLKQEKVLPKTTEVQLSNQTVMRIGSSSQYAAYKATEQEAGNAALTLNMDPVPAIPSNAVLVEDYKDQWGTNSFGWDQNRTVPVVIANRDGKDYQFPMAADVYISGKATVSNAYGVYGREARIIVTSTGELTFTMATLDRTTIIVQNGGKLNITQTDFKINRGAKLLAEGDQAFPGSLNTGGDLFVGGNMTAKKIDANNSAKTHVMGNMLVEDLIDLTNGSETAVEGTVKTQNILIDSNAQLWAGCCVWTKDLKLHNQSELSTEYIKAETTSISASTINMADQGVADLGKTVVGDVSDLKFNVVGDGEAMIVSTDFELQEQYSLTNNIGANFYFNYERFYVINQGKEQVTLPGKTNDGFHNVEIGTDKVNAGTPNAWQEGQCSPGFKKNTTPQTGDPETPGTTPEEPGTTPEEPGTTPENPGTTPEQPGTPEEPTTPVTPTTDGTNVTIVIPNDIEREWFLEADDFAIRRDGVFEQNIVPVNNTVERYGAKITEKNLVVNVENVNNLDFTTTKEYTYETYLWVTKESWSTFTAAQKEEFFSDARQGDGTDITARCQITSPEGYEVRYNVYKGLGGQNDTPYIKVSVHITKK